MSRIYKATKTYGHEQGLSCVFRQHRADSHCNQLHGYALSFQFEFAAEELDSRNWVQDFGGLKQVKQWLHDNFDHSVLVAEDDPHLDILQALEEDFSLAKVIQVPAVGCEAFAEFAGSRVGHMVWNQSGGRVWLARCTVAEHAGNSAGVAYAKEEWAGEF